MEPSELKYFRFPCPCPHATSNQRLNQVPTSYHIHLSPTHHCPCGQNLVETILLGRGSSGVLITWGGEGEMFNGLKFMSQFGLVFCLLFLLLIYSLMYYILVAGSPPSFPSSPTLIHPCPPRPPLPHFPSEKGRTPRNINQLWHIKL